MATGPSSSSSSFFAAVPVGPRVLLCRSGLAGRRGPLPAVPA